MQNLYRKIHRYFSKSNLRLLMLFGIIFSLAITTYLIKHQQDLRQRAGEQLCGGVYCSGIGSPATCVKMGNNSYGCITPNTLTAGQLCADQNNKPNNNACKSGMCSEQLHCSVALEDPVGNNLSCSPQNPQGCPTIPANPGDPNVNCDPFGNCTVKCGSSVCASNEVCVDLPTPFSDKCVPLSSMNGNSGNSGNNSGGSSNSCIPSGTVPCGGTCQYCDAGFTCGTDKKCYPPPSTGGTCANSSQTLCGGQCWSCGTAGIDCVNNTGVCKNSGCPSGQTAVSGKCCPSGTTALCGDGSCGPCSVAAIIPNPQPGTFSLSKPVMDCDKAALSWGTSSGATSYAIETYTDPSTTPVKTSPDQSGTTYTVTGLTKSTIYYFAIVAKSSTLGTKRTLTVNGITTSTCSPSTGKTTASSPKTPTSTSSNGSNSSPVPPKTSNQNTTTPTLTATITNPPSSNNSTTLSFSFTLPGIGAQSEFKNPNPTRKQRMVNIGLVNPSGAITTAQGTANFDNNTYTYKGTVNVPNLAPGTYTVKIRLDNTLWKKYPNAVNISAGSNNPSVSSVILVPGDLDQNNSLTIADYTNFVKCYKGLSTCTAEMQSLTNFDEDATTKDDLDDLTILQQGFKTQTQGD